MENWLRMLDFILNRVLGVRGRFFVGFGEVGDVGRWKEVARRVLNQIRFSGG